MSRLIPRVVYTSTVIQSGERILLGYKKRGRGQGKWTAIGGTVLENEAMSAAAVRQVKMDCGLEAKAEDLIRCGTLDYEWHGRPDCIHVNVFLLTEFKGVLRETDEYKFDWFHVTNIPYNSMASDDKLWLPSVLKRHQFIGHFNANTDKEWV